MIVLREYETVGQAAERLGVKRQRIHQLIKAGKLEAIQYGPRAWLVKIADVDRRLAGRPRAPSPAARPREAPMPEKDPQYLYCVHHDREPEVCGDSPLFPFWSDGKEPLICYNHMKRFNEEARRAPAEGEP